MEVGPRVNGCLFTSINHWLTCSIKYEGHANDFQSLFVLRSAFEFLVFCPALSVIALSSRVLQNNESTVSVNVFPQRAAHKQQVVCERDNVVSLRAAARGARHLT